MSFLFESNVDSEGSKTVTPEHKTKNGFESNVDSEGSKTHHQMHYQYNLFESNVDSEGSKTTGVCLIPSD